MAKMLNGLQVAIMAYEALLSIQPMSSPGAFMFRVENQRLLATLRDYIAQETGISPEAVQSAYENATHRLRSA